MIVSDPKCVLILIYPHWAHIRDPFTSISTWIRTVPNLLEFILHSATRTCMLVLKFNASHT